MIAWVYLHTAVLLFGFVNFRRKVILKGAELTEAPFWESLGVLPVLAAILWMVPFESAPEFLLLCFISAGLGSAAIAFVYMALKDGYVPPGGDSIVHAGQEVGETTSAAFGYTVGQALTLGYVPVALAETGTQVQVLDKEGNLHPAVVGLRSPYDPKGTRIRA